MVIERFKGILKSIKGAFKIAAVFLPLTLSLGSFVTGIGLVVDGAQNKVDVLDNYSATEIFAERSENDLDDLYNKNLNSEISNDEFIKKLEYYSSKQYKEDLINENREENAEFKPLLKQANLKLGWGLGVFIFGIFASFISSAFYYEAFDKFANLFKDGAKNVGDGFKDTFAKSLKNDLTKRPALTGAVGVVGGTMVNSAYKEDGEEIIPELDEDSL